MTLILAFVSVVIACMSLFGMAAPARILAVVRRAADRGGLWLASGVRVVLAVVLWFSAGTAHTPMTFKVLAVLALVAAVVLLAIGKAGLMRILDHVGAWPMAVVRLWFLVGLAFAGFLLWSSSPGWMPA